MNDLTKAGAAARLAVKQVHPNATSSYTGATSAVVYDGETGSILGRSETQPDSVEWAWVDAMKRLATGHNPDDVDMGPALR